MDRLTLLIVVVGTCLAEQSTVQIANSLLQVNITLGTSGTCVSHMFLNLELASFNGWSSDLLSTAGCGLYGSGSAISVDDRTLITPVGGTVTQQSPDSVTITGIALGSVATEDWSISLAGPSLSWTSTRTYLSNGTAYLDQAAAVWLQTTVGTYQPQDQSVGGNPAGIYWQDKVQMPSYSSMDNNVLNASSGLAWLPVNGTRALALGDSSTGDSKRILLSPAGISMQMAISDCRFAFSRPGGGWIGQQIGVGAECVVGPQTGPSAGQPFTAGAGRRITLNVTFSPAANGHGFFDFTAPSDGPAADTVALASTFAAVYHMPLGWIYGNSPASITCVHEASLFTQLNGLYRMNAPAEAGPGAPSVHATAARFVSNMLQQSVDETGYVYARWSTVTGNWNGSASMGLMDQFPHLLLSAYYHAVNTNRSSDIAAWMPTLDLVATYMRSTLLIDSTGVLTNALRCDGLANESCAGNWLDDVRFGWQDAIVAAYGVEAMRAMGDMKALIRDAAGAADYYALHDRMVPAYNEAFWDDAAGMYRDWVDRSGKPRTYFYLWQQYAAIEFGLAINDQAKRIMDTADTLYAQVAQQYNVSSAALWCTPTNLIPLSPSDLTINFDGEYVYPHYENGDCFHWHAGLEALALGRVRGAAASYARWQGVLSVFNTTRLWGQRYSWQAGKPEGYDVITDAMFALYGGVMGALNVRTSLFGGLQVLGPAAPQLEGSSWTFALGGRDVTVNVKDGWAHVTRG